MSYFKHLNRFLAGIVAVTFFVTNALTPAPIAHAQNVENTSKFFNENSFSIPAGLGKVTDIIKGPETGSLLIHIQEAHANFDAQKNIRDILRHLSKNYGIDLVLLEGAGNKLQPELLRFFPKDPELQSAVNDKLLQEGLLTGAEVFMIDQAAHGVRSMEYGEKKNTGAVRRTPSAAQAEAYGVENAEAYAKDREAYKTVYENRKTADDFLNAFYPEWQKQASRRLTKELREFLESYSAFEDTKLPLRNWLETLKSQALKSLNTDLSDVRAQILWPILVRFFRLRALEGKIDAARVESEKEAFFKSMGDFGAQTQNTKLETRNKSKIQNPNVSNKSISDFSHSNLKPAGKSDIVQEVEAVFAEAKKGNLPVYKTRFVFERLMDALPDDFPFDPYPNLHLQIQQMILMSELQGEALQMETKKLAGQIVEALVKTEDEKTLVRSLREYQLLQKLFHLELSREEYQQVVAREITPKRLCRGLQTRDQGPQTKKNFASVSSLQSPVPSLDSLFKTALDFYQGAVVRENYMMQRAREIMKERKQTKAVLITGGFHTDGFKQKITASGSSYIGITPAIGEVTKEDQGNYLRSLLGPQTIDHRLQTHSRGGTESLLGSGVGFEPSNIAFVPISNIAFMQETMPATWRRFLAERLSLIRLTVLGTIQPEHAEEFAAGFHHLLASITGSPALQLQPAFAPARSKMRNGQFHAETHLNEKLGAITKKAYFSGEDITQLLDPKYVELVTVSEENFVLDLADKTRQMKEYFPHQERYVIRVLGSDVSYRILVGSHRYGQKPWMKDEKKGPWAVIVRFVGEENVSKRSLNFIFDESEKRVVELLWESLKNRAQKVKIPAKEVPVIDQDRKETTRSEVRVGTGDAQLVKFADDQVTRVMDFLRISYKLISQRPNASAAVQGSLSGALTHNQATQLLAAELDDRVVTLYKTSKAKIASDLLVVAHLMAKENLDIFEADMLLKYLGVTPIYVEGEGQWQAVPEAAIFSFFPPANNKYNGADWKAWYSQILRTADRLSEKLLAEFDEGVIVPQPQPALARTRSEVRANDFELVKTKEQWIARKNYTIGNLRGLHGAPLTKMNEEGGFLQSFLLFNSSFRAIVIRSDGVRANLFHPDDVMLLSLNHHEPDLWAQYGKDATVEFSIAAQVDEETAKGFFSQAFEDLEKLSMGKSEEVDTGSFFVPRQSTARAEMRKKSQKRSFDFTQARHQLTMNVGEMATIFPGVTIDLSDVRLRTGEVQGSQAKFTVDGTSFESVEGRKPSSAALWRDVGFEVKKRIPTEKTDEDLEFTIQLNGVSESQAYFTFSSVRQSTVRSEVRAGEKTAGQEPQGEMLDIHTLRYAGQDEFFFRQDPEFSLSNGAGEYRLGFINHPMGPMTATLKRIGWQGNYSAFVSGQDLTWEKALEAIRKENADRGQTLIFSRRPIARSEARVNVPLEKQMQQMGEKILAIRQSFVQELPKSLFPKDPTGKQHEPDFLKDVAEADLNRIRIFLNQVPSNPTDPISVIASLKQHWEIANILAQYKDENKDLWLIFRMFREDLAKMEEFTKTIALEFQSEKEAIRELRNSFMKRLNIGGWLPRWPWLLKATGLALSPEEMHQAVGATFSLFVLDSGSRSEVRTNKALLQALLAGSVLASATGAFGEITGIYLTTSVPGHLSMTSPWQGNYHVDTTTNLGASWQTVGASTNAGQSTVSFTDAAINAANKFYRGVFETLPLPNGWTRLTSNPNFATKTDTSYYVKPSTGQMILTRTYSLKNLSTGAETVLDSSTFTDSYSGYDVSSFVDPAGKVLIYHKLGNIGYGQTQTIFLKSLVNAGLSATISDTSIRSVDFSDNLAAITTGDGIVKMVNPDTLAVTLSYEETAYLAARSGVNPMKQFIWRYILHRNYVETTGWASGVAPYYSLPTDGTRPFEQFVREFPGWRLQQLAAGGSLQFYDVNQHFVSAQVNVDSMKAFISEYLGYRGYNITNMGWLNGFAPYYAAPDHADRSFSEFESEMDSVISAGVYVTPRSEARAGEASLEDRYQAAFEKLQKYGQAHVLAFWNELARPEQEELLYDIGRIDLEKEFGKDGLYQRLVVRKEKPSVDLSGAKPEEPIQEKRPEALAAGKKLLKAGKDNDQAEIGMILVAGGSGSGMGMTVESPKGVFDDGKPFSKEVLYETMVKKLKALANANGHKKIYPLVIMTSDVTHDATKEYFEDHDWFGQQDRIILVKQRVLPVLRQEDELRAFFTIPGFITTDIRSLNQTCIKLLKITLKLLPFYPSWIKIYPKGSMVLTAKHKIDLQGGGHGDAFDYALLQPDVKKFLDDFGVKEMIYANIDNPLYPLDVHWIGEHVLSADRPRPAGLAHMSEVLISKEQQLALLPAMEARLQARLSDLFRLKNGQRQPRKYSDGTPEQRQSTKWGMPSFRIISRERLETSLETPYTVANKTTTDVFGDKIHVWKFESNSDDKPSDGVTVAMDGDDTFASMKKLTGDAETPPTSKKLQSKHWARILKEAGFTVDEGLSLELPWLVDSIPTTELTKRLQAIDFPKHLTATTPGGKPLAGYWVKDPWDANWNNDTWTWTAVFATSAATAPAAPKAGQAIRSEVREDGSFRVDYQDWNNQIVITGPGEEEEYFKADEAESMAEWLVENYEVDAEPRGLNVILIRGEPINLRAVDATEKLQSALSRSEVRLPTDPREIGKYYSALKALGQVKNAIQRKKKISSEAFVLGLRSGTTMWNYFLPFLGEAIGKGKISPDGIAGVGTSTKTTEIGKDFGIRFSELDSLVTPENQRPIDIAIDGADELDKSFYGIKGGGGAHADERPVIDHAKKVIIIVDQSKMVDTLGKFLLPLEVEEDKGEMVMAQLRALGGKDPNVRAPDGVRFRPGNRIHRVIIDVNFNPIKDPAKLAADLEHIPGLVSHGLFFVDRPPDWVIVGKKDGSAEVLHPPQRSETRGQTSASHVIDRIPTYDMRNTLYKNARSEVRESKEAESSYEKNEKRLLATLEEAVKMPATDKSPSKRDTGMIGGFSIVWPLSEGPGKRQGAIEKFQLNGQPAQNLNLANFNKAAQTPVPAGEWGFTEGAANCATAAIPIFENGKVQTRLLHIPLAIGGQSLETNKRLVLDALSDLLSRERIFERPPVFFIQVRRDTLLAKDKEGKDFLDRVAEVLNQHHMPVVALIRPFDSATAVVADQTGTALFTETVDPANRSFKFDPQASWLFTAVNDGDSRGKKPQQVAAFSWDRLWEKAGKGDMYIRWDDTRFLPVSWKDVGSFESGEDKKECSYFFSPKAQELDFLKKRYDGKKLSVLSPEDMDLIIAHATSQYDADSPLELKLLMEIGRRVGVYGKDLGATLQIHTLQYGFHWTKWTHPQDMPGWIFQFPAQGWEEGLDWEMLFSRLHEADRSNQYQKILQVLQPRIQERTQRLLENLGNYYRPERSEVRNEIFASSLIQGTIDFLNENGASDPQNATVKAFLEKLLRKERKYLQRTKVHLDDDNGTLRGFLKWFLNHNRGTGSSVVPIALMAIHARVASEGQEQVETEHSSFVQSAMPWATARSASDLNASVRSEVRNKSKVVVKSGIEGQLPKKEAVKVVLGVLDKMRRSKTGTQSAVTSLNVVTALSDENFAEFMKSAQVIVIKIWRDGCPPCAIFAEIFEQVARSLGNPSVKSGAFELTDEPSLFRRTFLKGLEGIPAKLLFQKGELQKTHVGKMGEEQLRQFITRSEVRANDFELVKTKDQWVARKDYTIGNVRGFHNAPSIRINKFLRRDFLSFNQSFRASVIRSDGGHGSLFSPDQMIFLGLSHNTPQVFEKYGRDITVEFSISTKSADEDEAKAFFSEAFAGIETLSMDRGEDEDTGHFFAPRKSPTRSEVREEPKTNPFDFTRAGHFLTLSVGKEARIFPGITIRLEETKLRESESKGSQARFAIYPTLYKHSGDASMPFADLKWRDVGFELKKIIPTQKADEELEFTLRLTGVDSSGQAYFTFSSIRKPATGIARSEARSSLSTKRSGIVAPVHAEVRRGQWMNVMLAGTVMLFAGIRESLAGAYGVPNLPGRVYTQGRNIYAQDRNEDGTLGQPYLFHMKGVDWTPSSIGSDPNNNPIGFQQEIFKWATNDIPQIAAMNANAFRLYYNMGTNDNAKAVLDLAYKYGLKVMEDPIAPFFGNTTNYGYISSFVPFRKYHPAFLGYSIANEPDLNYFYGKKPDLASTMLLVDQSAQLVNSLDTNHISMTFLGEPHIPAATGLSYYHYVSPDFAAWSSGPFTSVILSDMLPNVKAFGFQLYRGGWSFGDAMSQLGRITGRPLIAGEYGTDSWNAQTYTTDQAMQRDSELKLSYELHFGSAAFRTNGIFSGGLVFSSADQWWPYGYVNQQDHFNGGSSGHPDGANNEEDFGLTDIGRNPKLAYYALQQLWSLNGQSAIPLVTNPVITAVSRRANAEFDLNGKTIFWRQGGDYGARGFNVAVLDEKTGLWMKEMRHFDTYINGGVYHADLQGYLNGLPNGSIVALSMADDGGMTQSPASGTKTLLQNSAWGSAMIGSVGYQQTWAMISIKGFGKLAENWSSSGADISVQATPTLTVDPNYGRRQPFTVAQSPVIQGVKMTNGNFKVIAQVQSNFIYQIEYRDDLRTGNWNIARRGIVADSNALNWIDDGSFTSGVMPVTNGTLPQHRFYRVTVIDRVSRSEVREEPAKSSEEKAFLKSLAARSEMRRAEQLLPTPESFDIHNFRFSKMLILAHGESGLTATYKVETVPGEKHLGQVTLGLGTDGTVQRASDTTPFGIKMPPQPSPTSNSYFKNGESTLGMTEVFKIVADSTPRTKSFSDPDLPVWQSTPEMVEVLKIASGDEFYTFWDNAIRSSRSEVREPTNAELIRNIMELEALNEKINNHEISSEKLAEVNSLREQHVAAVREMTVRLSRNLMCELLGQWRLNREIARSLGREHIAIENDFMPIPLIRKLDKLSTPGRRYNGWKKISFDNKVLAALIREATAFEDYLQNKNTWVSQNKPEMLGEKVLYFSAEFGMKILQIYGGGLGILSGDHVRGASDIGLDGFTAFGLLYKKGYFRQRITKNGQQLVDKTYEWIRLEDLPIEAAKDPQHPEKDLVVSIPFPGGRKVLAKVWKAVYGKTPLYLLDTDIDGNSNEDRAITRELYRAKGESPLRMEQYHVLGTGGMLAARALGIQEDALHLNDCHPMFAAVQGIASIMQGISTQKYPDDQVRFEMALMKAVARNVFTTHTPIPAGNEAPPVDVIRPFIEAIFPNNPYAVNRILSLGNLDGKFNIAAFSQRASSSHNAVSALHGQVARGMWKRLYPGVVADQVPISGIVNSVHAPYWQVPEIRDLFKRVFEDPELRELMESEDQKPLKAKLRDKAWMAQYVNVDDDQLWDLHLERKQKLLTELHLRLLNRVKRGDATGEDIKYLETFDPEAFTIGFARRAIGYKRMTLIFQDLKRFAKIAARAGKPIQLVFGGKAHPEDGDSQALIVRLHELAKLAAEEVAKEENVPVSQAKIKFVFVEEYNVDIARYLESGVDVWLNTPARPLEASGTSGMKAGMNGVLNLSISDGWSPEGIEDGVNGFLFGITDGERNDLADAEALYKKLDEEIIDCYYNHPDEWIRKVKASIVSTIYWFGMERMLRDYISKEYAPAVKKGVEMTDARAYQLVQAQIARRSRILERRQQWGQITVEPFTQDVVAGEEFEMSVVLNLSGLQPEDLAVDLILDGNGSARWIGMDRFEPLEDGKYRFIIKTKLDGTDIHKVKFRVMPRDPGIWLDSHELEHVTKYVESQQPLRVFDRDLIKFRKESPVERGMLFFVNVPEELGVEKMYWAGEPNHWRPIDEPFVMTRVKSGLWAIVIPEEVTRGYQPLQFKFYMHMPGRNFEDPRRLWLTGSYPVHSGTKNASIYIEQDNPLMSRDGVAKILLSLSGAARSEVRTGKRHRYSQEPEKQPWKTSDVLSPAQEVENKKLKTEVMARIIERRGRAAKDRWKANSADANTPTPHRSEVRQAQEASVSFHWGTDKELMGGLRLIPLGDSMDFRSAADDIFPSVPKALFPPSVMHEPRDLPKSYGYYLLVDEKGIVGMAQIRSFDPREIHAYRRMERSANFQALLLDVMPVVDDPKRIEAAKRSLSMQLSHGKEALEEDGFHFWFRERRKDIEVKLEKGSLTKPRRENMRVRFEKAPKLKAGSEGGSIKIRYTPLSKRQDLDNAKDWVSQAIAIQNESAPQDVTYVYDRKSQDAAVAAIVEHTKNRTAFDITFVKDISVPAKKNVKPFRIVVNPLSRSEERAMLQVNRPQIFKPRIVKRVLANDPAFELTESQLKVAAERIYSPNPKSLPTLAQELKVTVERVREWRDQAVRKITNQAQWFDEQGRFKPSEDTDPINRLNLSGRAVNALTNANLKTLGKLTQKTEAELLEIEDLGRASVDEIKEKLFRNGGGRSLRSEVRQPLPEVGIQAWAWGQWLAKNSDLGGGREKGFRAVTEKLTDGIVSLLAHTFNATEIVARTIMPEAFAVVPMTFTYQPRSLLGKARIATARMALGVKTVKASDAFILGSELALDHGALAVARIILGDAPVAVIVRNAKDRVFVERFNKELLAAKRKEIFITSDENIGEVRAALKQQSQAERINIKALLYGGETLKDQLSDVTVQRITQRMLQNFINLAGDEISALVQDVQAQFAVTRSA